MQFRLALDVRYAELTPNRAVVKVELSGGEELAGLCLTGSLRGPRCIRGSTLPATYPLQAETSRSANVGTRPRIGARSVIIEPIFWSPDWPALYDLKVQLRRGSQVIETAERSLGLRPLAVVGKNLVYAGKNWVLRGILHAGPLEGKMDACQQSALALVAAANLLSEAVLLEASEQGVLVVAQLRDQTTAAAELARLSGFAAVAMGVLPAGCEPLLGDSSRNLLLAHQLRQGEPEPPPDDARLVLGQVVQPESFAAWAKGLSRPVIACRPLAAVVSIEEARRECDRLQRDLAPYGQFAGYIV